MYVSCPFGCDRAQTRLSPQVLCRRLGIVIVIVIVIIIVIVVIVIVVVVVIVIVLARFRETLF